jgi:hypothetical protein
MKIIQTLLAIVLLFFGVLWTLQGANILGGSFMSGQNQWLIIGIFAAIAGLALLYWTHGRSRAG